MFDYQTNIDKLYPDDMLFNDGVMLVAHNSFASLEDGWTGHPMQQYDFIHQFYYGARGFMIDVYKDGKDLVLLHQKALKNVKGVGSSATKIFYLEDFLNGIKNLLDTHDKTLITLIVENNGVSQKEIKSAIEKTKLEGYLLQKDPNDPNLRFGEMRKNNQRLIVFAENGQKTEEGIYSTNYYKETTFILQGHNLCSDRHENRVPFNNPNVKIFIMNHFHRNSCFPTVDVFFDTSLMMKTGKFICSTTNDYNQIMKRVELCITNGNNPTFIAIDFIEQGNEGGALKVVNDLTNKSFYNKYLQHNNKEKDL